MTTTTRLLTVGLATAATAFSGTAAMAQSGDDAVRDADLVALSGGAYLHFATDDGAKPQSVTIAGKTAKIRSVADEGEGAFHAIMLGKKAKTGGTYAVVIRVKQDGKTVVYRDRLVVHRRHARVS